MSGQYTCKFKLGLPGAKIKIAHQHLSNDLTFIILYRTTFPHLIVGAPLNDSVRLLLMGDRVTLTILFSCRDTFRYHD